MEFEVKKTFTFDDDDLICILSSALSGGVNYWAFTEYNPTAYRLAKKRLIENGKEEDEICIEDVLLQMLKSGSRIKFIDVEEQDDEWILDMENFEKGIRQAVEKDFWNGVIYDCDGCVADNIIQLALFEEIVYG